MEYLVESHMGGYYVSNGDPKIIEAYCEQCGDSDHILLSWEEGYMLDAMLKYFSNIKMSNEQLEKDKNEAIVTLEDLIDYLTYSYDEDRCMIYALAEDNIINLNEKISLLKQVTITQKEQFKLLKNIYYSNGFVRVKKIK